jgi:hypothetical protein
VPKRSGGSRRRWPRRGYSRTCASAQARIRGIDTTADCADYCCGA